MKRLILTAFFASYIIFLPFILAGCSGAADIPYAPEAKTTTDADGDGVIDPDLSEGEETNTELTRCQAQEFLTSDCVAIISAENDRIADEQKTVADAMEALADFNTCKKFTAEEPAADDDAAEGEEAETPVDTGPDCLGETLPALINAYQLCVSLPLDDRYADCYRIVREVDNTQFACEDEADSVTADFCDAFVADE